MGHNGSLFPVYSLGVTGAGFHVPLALVHHHVFFVGLWLLPSVHRAVPASLVGGNMEDCN